MASVTLTPRLHLRPIARADADALFTIYGDPQTNMFNPFGPHPDQATSQAVLATWLDHWQAHGFGLWAISAVETPDQVVGFGGLSFYQYLAETKLNLGYRFAPAAWGKGYATELGRRALEAAFHELRQEQVFGLVRPANLASIRVLEKLGMRRSGTLDDVPGQPESYVYTIDRPRFIAGAASQEI